MIAEGQGAGYCGVRSSTLGRSKNTDMRSGVCVAEYDVVGGRVDEADELIKLEGVVVVG